MTHDAMADVATLTTVSDPPVCPPAGTTLELERYWYWVIGYWAIFTGIG